ncbi:MAG: hypothetical protein ACREN7_07230 [Candidatus Dormibacteria bacterium]
MIQPEVSERQEEETRTASDGSERRTVVRTRTTAATMGQRVTSAIWLAALIVDVILALDFIFRILGAAQVGFVAFIAGIASRLSIPFQGVVATTVGSGRLAYWPDVVGIVVYSILAAIAVGIVAILIGRSRPRTDAGGGSSL